MNIEDRLRSAFEDRALEVETSPQAIFEINRRISSKRERSGFAVHFRPSYVLAGAACAVLAAVAVLSVMQQDPQPDEIGVFDNSPPAATSAPDESSNDGSGGSDEPGATPGDSDDSVATAPDAATPTAEAAPPAAADPGSSDVAAVGLPSPERSRVVWPTSTTSAAEWPISADAAAAGFVDDYLGLSTANLEVAATNGATGTAVLKAPTSGAPASTIELAAFDVGDGSERWAVVAARSAMLTLDEIDVGSVVPNPAAISGTGEGVGGAILARIYAADQSPVTGLILGQATAEAGNVGAPAAFDMSIGYPADSTPNAVLVLTNDATLGGVTVVPVTTSVPVTPCKPAASDPGAITVAVFFPCESSTDNSLVERSHTAPATGAGLLGALQALATGPTDTEVTAGLYSALPTDPGVVVSVAEADGWAIVELTPAIESANGPLALSQLNATAFAQAPVAAVEYRIEGDCERFAAAVGEDGCRVYSRAGSFPPPTGFEPQVLLAAAGGDRAITLDPSSSSESVATLVAGGAGGFRLTGATATAGGVTWLQVVGLDGSLGWLDAAGITVQPTASLESQRQLMIDRAGDAVAVGSLGDVGRLALSDRGLWTALVTDTASLSYLPADGLREIDAWTTERDLGDSAYPLGSTLAEVFGANSLDVISVNEAAAFGTEPPAALSGMAFISIATNQTLPAEPEESDPEADPEAEPTEEPVDADEPTEPETAPVVINVYFDFIDGEPKVIALSAHPILPPSE